MITRTCALCAVLLLCTSVAAGQDAADPPLGPPNVGSPIPSPVTLTNEQLSRRLLTLEVQVNALADNLTESATQVGQLRSEVNELTDRINEELEKQRQILDAISSVDSAGQRIPRLSAIMQSSPEFQQDMSQAVHGSLQREGQFVIDNKTSTYQRIFVNRTEFGVEPGQTLTLRVPIGTVTTQLPGKNLENWTLTAPTYGQRIEIVPTSSTVTAFSPIGNPVYVYPPSYYVP